MDTRINILFNTKKQLEEKPNLTIVLPIYNEIACLPIVLRQLFDYLKSEQFKYKWQLIFVDDCSSDGSFEYLSEKAADAPENVSLAVVQLAKKSGSHVAITAGLNLSNGYFTLVMASDGQDPVEVIGTLVEKWEKGFQIVLASRSENQDHGMPGKIFSAMAWKIMNWATEVRMPDGGCDMLGLDRLALQAFNRLDERNTIFIYQLLALGFKQIIIKYTKKIRIAGKSKWSFYKKFAVMMDAITGYSSKPLRLITRIGFLMSLVLVARWAIVFYRVYVLHQPPRDLDIILNSFFTSLAVHLLILGAVSGYIWRILDETRKRPIYEIGRIGGRVFQENNKPS